MKDFQVSWVFLLLVVWRWCCVGWGRQLVDVEAKGQPHVASHMFFSAGTFTGLRLSDWASLAGQQVSSYPVLGL